MRFVAATASKRVTSVDVAREAGVARSTVSYVLNRTPHQSIPENTRQRVLDAAARLGYAPSAAARTLRRGHSDVVLCFLPPWPLGSAAGSFLSELTEAFDRHGLTLVFRTEGVQGRSFAEIRREISPAAVLSQHPVDPEEDTAMRAAGVQAVVLLYSDVDSQNGQLIRPDVLIGSMQARHLLERGHQRLAYAYPSNAVLKGFAEPRLSGARSECLAAGVEPPAVSRVALAADSAAEAIRAWRLLDPPVTAVCAYNDELAQALLAGMRTLGLQCPEDLALVGADDIPAAALAYPPLTTVAIDHKMEAHRIVQAVMAALNNEPAADAPDGADMFRLVVRESS